MPYTKPPKILIVDDVPTNIRVLAETLHQDYHVHIATSGKMALEILESEEDNPDLILLDVMMPKRNGYEVCQAIRARAEWQTVRIIMLTAKGREVEQERGLAMGADDYVAKPFSTRDLVQKVRDMLGLPTG